MKLLLSTIFLLFSCFLTAQQGSWTYFPSSTGPISLAARGNTILVGTPDAGIVRFDTLGNRSYFNSDNSGIPTEAIQMLAIDAEGKWWMRHAAGISRFDGAAVQTWALEETGVPAGAIVRAMKAAPDSSLCVATDMGVAIFKDGAWTVLNTSNSGLPSNFVWDVAFGPDGKRYYGTNGSGIAVQDGANWTSYNTANTGINTLNNIYAVAVTTEGTLWAIGGLGNTGIRLAKFESGIWTGYNALEIGLLPPVSPFLRKLTADASGRLCLLSNSAVSILDQGVWTHYLSQDIGCALNNMVSPVVDGADKFEVLSDCELLRFEDSAWIKWHTGLPGQSPGFLYDGIGEGADGSIWFGAEDGNYIARLQGNTWERYFPTDYGALSNDVYSVQAGSDGSMWFGLANARILRYAGGAWTLFDTCATYVPGEYVLTSAEAPNGDRWFSFAGQTGGSGLARYSADGQWQFFPPANTPLQNAYIRKIIIDDDGTAWFTTANASKGILRYNGVVWDSITVNNSDLPSNRVYFLAKAPDGAIWAATYAGLARYDGQDWTVLTSSNSGLPSNLVGRVAFDKAGGMYVGYAPQTPGTPGARVAEFRGGEWTELLPPNWSNSSQDDPDAFFVDSQNRLWFSKFYDPFGNVYRYDPMLVRTEEPETAESWFKASPNPTSGLLTLRLETPLRGDARLQVWNAFGQMVHQAFIPQTAETSVPVDMSALPAGVYWVRLWEDGGEGGVVRVVKQ